jgi:hypothetical protein
MEWESWLEKSSLTDRQKELAKEIENGDNEDRKNLFAKKLEPKEASWESWLDKNNGIETDHKKEDKKEWDGKFSSSTIRDDAENDDDDKAVSEEESLEELTDGKLEEIEKLKSWEVFLKANLNATGGLVQNKREINIGERKPAIHNSGSNLKNSKIATHGQGVESSDSNRNTIGKLPLTRGTLGNSHKEIPPKTSGRTVAEGGDVPTKQGGKPKIDGEKGMKEGAKDLGVGAVTYSPSEVTATGTHRVTETGTREVLQHEQDRQDAVADGWDPDTGLKHQPPTKDQKDQHELTPISRAWEGWLEKKTTTEPNVGVHQEQPYAEARTAKEIEEAAQQAASTGNVDIGKLIPDMKKKKSWNEWLEKQQGAGDARFGNQHLTGMEQHPVADDDSLELSPETEENNEKEDKKEDKEEEDNKPYKALR